MGKRKSKVLPVYKVFLPQVQAAGLRDVFVLPVDKGSGYKEE